MGRGWKGRTCWAVIRVARIIGLKEFSCRESRGQVMGFPRSVLRTYHPIVVDYTRILHLTVDWVRTLPFCMIVSGG
jgi:hypothetical protein